MWGEGGGCSFVEAEIFAFRISVPVNPTRRDQDTFQRGHSFPGHGPGSLDWAQGSFCDM